MPMVPRLMVPLLLLGLAGTGALAQRPGLAKPNEVLSQVVEHMPRGERQRVRVLTATFQPGDKTVFHTHRQPVTVYVLEGEFRLELEGLAPVVLRQGDAYVEPPHVKMTGFNQAAQPLKVVIFYVSEPDGPFLDPVH